MAQAQGGTAGSSVGAGNGSMGASSSRGGGMGGGLGGSNGGSGNSGNSNAASSNATSSNTASAAATAAAAGDSKQTGSIMGGLSNAVSNARASRASSPGNTGSTSSPAAASAAAAGAPQGALSASDVAGIDSESHSAAENLAARDQGFRDTANAKTTAATMGGLGTIGSAVGGIASKITSAAAPDETSDLGANHAVGQAWANSVGPSKTTSMATSLAAGILGGPIGSALAGFALGIANDQAAKAANPTAMAATPQQIANRATFGQQSATSSSDTGSGAGNSNMASSMFSAAQQPSTFQAADDYSEQRKVNGLNLGSII